MDTVFCKELIVSTLSRRGNGVKHSPIRIITEIFEKDGTKIAEHDPAPETFTKTDLINFSNWVYYLKQHPDKTNGQTVTAWLDSVEANKQ